MNCTDTVAQQAQSVQAGMARCNQGANKSLHGLRNRRALAIMAATAAVGTGMALNWAWLVAAGVAPLILSVFPCLVMCALGLCASKLFGGSANSEAQADSGEACASSNEMSQRIT